jgi:hypothetical protein
VSMVLSLPDLSTRTSTTVPFTSLLFLSIQYRRAHSARLATCIALACTRAPTVRRGSLSSMTISSRKQNFPQGRCQSSPFSSAVRSKVRAKTSPNVIYKLFVPNLASILPQMKSILRKWGVQKRFEFDNMLSIDNNSRIDTSSA